MRFSFCCLPFAASFTIFVLCVPCIVFFCVLLCPCLLFALFLRPLLSVVPNLLFLVFCFARIAFCLRFRLVALCDCFVICVPFVYSLFESRPSLMLLLWFDVHSPVGLSAFRLEMALSPEAAACSKLHSHANVFEFWLSMPSWGFPHLA